MVGLAANNFVISLNVCRIFLIEKAASSEMFPILGQLLFKITFYVLLIAAAAECQRDKQVIGEISSIRRVTSIFRGPYLSPQSVRSV